MRRGPEFAEDDTVFLPVFRCPGLYSKLALCFAYGASDQKRLLSVTGFHALAYDCEQILR
jgi:hypothetical protein